MFTIDEFWAILEFLKSGATESTELDRSVFSAALSEKSKTQSYFSTVLDQQSFSTQDYLRLKNFFVDWYSTFKTILASQKTASDPHSLPAKHIEELFRSFGYTQSLEELSSAAKVNFFLDLVNLYKIKGTPLCISRVLSYFGLKQVELVEYWLQKNESGNLVFRAELAVPTVVPISLGSYDISFHDAVAGDPHWLLTESQIETLVATNKINLPSKSPYFGIRAYYGVGDLSKIIACLERRIQDDYLKWKNTGTKVTEIYLKLIKTNVSLMELYLSCCYLLINAFGAPKGTIGNPFLCYNGPETSDWAEVFELYDSYIVRPSSRQERKEKYEEWTALFTRPVSENFLKYAIDPGEKLQEINSSLKEELDSWVASGTAETLLAYFLNELSSWLESNIYAETSNLSLYTVGSGSLSNLYKVLNFFKPYRARMQFSYILHTDNPLLDSLIQEDVVEERYSEIAVDWDNADALPGIYPGWQPSGRTVVSDPSLGEGRIKNIYVDSGGSIKAVWYDSTSEESTTIVSNPPAGSHRVYNVYLTNEEMLPQGKKLVVEFESTPVSSPGTATTVISLPPTGDYMISEMHMSTSGFVVISYESIPASWSLDSTAALYYSRNTYDTGSFFDKGASMDWSWKNRTGFFEYISQELFSIYNCHPPDSTCYVSYGYEFADSTNLVSYYQYGGFTNFDCGWCFDTPFANDLCLLTVMYTLREVTISSSGATSVPITVSPPDFYGNSDGVT